MADPSLRKLLALLESPVTDAPDGEVSTAALDPWRDRIDALDRAIIRLLNERAVCAGAIGVIKKQLALPVYVPSREQEVLRNVLTSNAGPLSDAAVQRLFERIIDETRSLERHLIQEGTDEAIGLPPAALPAKPAHPPTNE